MAEVTLEVLTVLVRDMMSEQRKYWKAIKGTPEKGAAYKESVRLETIVWDMVKLPEVKTQIELFAEIGK